MLLLISCWCVLVQWGHPRLYVGWRVVWAVYHLAWSLYDWTTDALETERPGTWLIYLTNWTFLLLTVSTLLATLAVVYVTCSARKFTGHRLTTLVFLFSWFFFVCYVCCLAFDQVTA